MIKVIVIEGPTASGKTSLAVELAKRFEGEIVGADSMQIYKKMQIATAKPTTDETHGVSYHMIDFLEPDDEFSVADYVQMAHEAISGIHSRGNLPIICGGTGLYIDSLLNNICFAEADTDPAIRDNLTKLAAEKGGEYMLKMLGEFDPETASQLHANNLKRIVRAIEVYKTTGITMSEQNRLSKECESPYDSLKFFLNFKNREKLYERIDNRVDKMISQGLIDEARSVLSEGDLKTSGQAIGYKELKPYFNGEKELSECIDSLKRSTRRYAKRQITWFKHDALAKHMFVDDFSGVDELADCCSVFIRDFLKGE